MPNTTNNTLIRSILFMKTYYTRSFSKVNILNKKMTSHNIQVTPPLCNSKILFFYSINDIIINEVFYSKTYVYHFAIL